MAKTAQNMGPIEASSCSNVTWSLSSKLHEKCHFVNSNVLVVADLSYIIFILGNRIADKTTMMRDFTKNWINLIQIFGVRYVTT